MNQSEKYKSGFVSIIGRPNAGKSTLLNNLIGQKIAIMSNKPQTTRNTIQGVLTVDGGQVVFIDTPGIHKPKSKLGDYMVKAAENTMQEVDLILLVVDVTTSSVQGEQQIIERLEQVNTPVFLIMNKIDLIHPEQLLPLIERYRSLYDFAEYIPISALNGNNLAALKEKILEHMPEGPQYYPADQITDHPEQFIVAELIREKVLLLTREEIPHSIAVVVEEMGTGADGKTVVIHATIYTEKQTQKRILIGKQGSMLKEVGRLAREEAERLLGSKVYLELWVKVKEDWRNREGLLHHFGYQQDR